MSRTSITVSSEFLDSLSEMKESEFDDVPGEPTYEEYLRYKLEI